MKSLYPILSTLSFAFVPLCLSAQLSVSPSTAVNSNFSFDTFDVSANSFVTNNYDQAVAVTWIRNVIELPEDWDSAICDKNECHFYTANQATFMMEAGETGNIDVHVYNWDATPGSAIVEVDLVADISPLDTVTATFIFDNALQTVERVSQYMQVYPNPTVDFVWLKGDASVQRVEIFDLSGKLVSEANLFGSERIDMTGLPSGQYIIRTFDGNTPISVNVVSRL